MWLASPKVRPVAVEDGVLHLECPTPLFQVTIRDRLARQLAVAASEVLAVPVTEVRCRVSGAAIREHERKLGQAEPATVGSAGSREPAARTPETATFPRPAPAAGRTWGHGFKPLEHFVVGTCNRLAYDAIQRILDDPHHPVNPLFIHGASGLGKTHLEQGLALAFKERYPKSKVQYIRCEQFTNDYITACEQGAAGIQAFRVRMRHPDLLLIDDIHFLSQGQKLRTKEELFATFNELSEHGKKLVITSDAGPKDIQYLEERFIQRFSGGLVIALQKPDPAVRREVLRAKARAQGVTLADDVVDFVAEHIIDNMRELEGAVNKLVQFSHSFQRRLDLPAARQALADMIERGSVEPLHTLILREVADHFGLIAADLTGKNRSGPRSTARHVAMYVLKHARSDTYSAIGQTFGVKSHSSVAYACEQVGAHRATDPKLDGFINELLLRVKRG